MGSVTIKMGVTLDELYCYKRYKGHTIVIEIVSINNENLYEGVVYKHNYANPRFLYRSEIGEDVLFNCLSWIDEKESNEPN